MKQGDKVVHPKLGDGVIVGCIPNNGEPLWRVEFSDGDAWDFKPEKIENYVVDSTAIESFDEEASEFIDTTRNAVLKALDETVSDGKGWRDADLKELFTAVDKIAKRNFLKSQGLLTD